MCADDPQRRPAGCDQAELATLAAWIGAAAQAGAGRTWIVGLVGAPGAGKSTLAAALIAACPLAPSVTVSLDDFYLESAERLARGFARRGPPGTHDLALLAAFLRQIRRGDSPLAIPRFDRERERRLSPLSQPGPLRLCIIEGWFVGARAPGYEALADSLDQLIYLDVDLAAARMARLRREAELRQAGCGGMSDAEVGRFWDEALAPHLATLVLPLRERADAVVSIDAAHRITGLALRNLGRRDAAS